MAKPKLSELDSNALDTNLEEVGTLDSSQHTAVFFPDHAPALSAKGSFAEGLFGLLVKDISYHHFCQEILILMVNAVPSQAASLLEIDPSGEFIFFRAATGVSSDQIVNFSFPLGKGIAGQVIREQKPQIANELSENQVHLSSLKDAVGFDAKNLIALPIMVRGKVYGVLELLNHAQKASFDESDVQLLSALCKLLGYGLEIRMMLAGQSVQKS